MESKLPHAEYDELIVTVGLEWLAQYSRFLRRSPELLETLAARQDAYEMVPIPRQILDHLAVPGLVGSGSLGLLEQEAAGFMPSAVDGQAIADFQSVAVDVVREFVSALNTGQAPKAASLFGQTFVNADGRNRDEIVAALMGLFDHAPDQRLRIDDLRAAGRTLTECVVNLCGAWSASAEPAAVTEPIALEFIVGKDSDNTIAITGVRAI